MSNIFLSIIIAGLLLLFFLSFLISGLRKRNKKVIFISIIFLFASIISGFWVGYLFASKAYNKIRTVKIDNPFRPRTGIEIYSALFGKPKKNCVEVTNKMDQLVPRLDCCIWLEFKTCPEELNRIIALETYEKTELFAIDTMSYMPGYNPRPEWFKPNLLGDKIMVFRNHNPMNPNRDQVLLFSKDSTHVFYCDMAE